MSDLAKQLGKRIYLFRKENGLTQAALAEKAKISNEFMSSIERGAKLPSLLSLERVSTALRVDIKELLNFDQTGFRKNQQITRDGLDIAKLYEDCGPRQRRQILNIVRILAQPVDE
jgi:transcriptional regulator with XRE-family HTH domain